MKINATIKGMVMDVFKEEKKDNKGVDILVQKAVIYQSGTKNNIQVKIEDEAEFKKLQSQVHKEVSLNVEIQDWAFNNRSGMSCKLLF
jgi:hypothetical protein